MTVLAHLFLNEAAELDFGIEISGTEETSMNARFIIDGPQFGIICECVEENGVITAKVPKLTGILPSGEYSSRLEVIIGGKHFQPLMENIQLNNPIAVSATPTPKYVTTPVVNLKATTVKVRVQENTVAEKPITKPLVRSEVEKRTFSDYVAPSSNINADIDRKMKLAEKIKSYEKQLATLKQKI